ncbi:MAG: arginine--tRNA ligase, partial [Cyclobacteriaceae bacterium]|nr:arginine--tRNA ligase [Cyclobacteriaceae bacterium]
MQRIEKIIKDLVAQAALKHWDIKLDVAYVQVQKTKREFEGDFTLVVFPLLRYSKQSPEQTGEILGA